jgi:putative hydrolase of HD superfamily
MNVSSKGGFMDRGRLDRQIAFIVEMDKLKQVLRKTLTIHSDRRENDAEHSWHLALMAVILREYAGSDIDLLRVIKMVIVHDLVEIDAGDTYCYSDYDPAEKLKTESRAAKRIFGMLPEDQAREFLDAWQEFERGETPEARFAVALDRLQPLLLNYHVGGSVWQENAVHKHQVLKRAAPIGEGSADLWEYGRDLIERAASQALLPE